MESGEIDYDFDEYEAKRKGYDSVEEMYWNEGREMTLEEELEFATEEDFDENRNYRCETSRNCVDSFRCKNSHDMDGCVDCEECKDCDTCHRCTKCEDCLMCHDCYLCIDCQDIKNCRYCYGVKSEGEAKKGLSYIWEDKQLTRNEWFNKFGQLKQNRAIEIANSIAKLFINQMKVNENKYFINTNMKGKVVNG